MLLTILLIVRRLCICCKILEVPWSENGSFQPCVPSMMRAGRAMGHFSVLLLPRIDCPKYYEVLEGFPMEETTS